MKTLSKSLISHKRHYIPFGLLDDSVTVVNFVAVGVVPMTLRVAVVPSSGPSAPVTSFDLVAVSVFSACTSGSPF